VPKARAKEEPPDLGLGLGLGLGLAGPPGAKRREGDAGAPQAVRVYSNKIFITMELHWRGGK